MQTKQKIQQLLASAGVSPNKRRGQNFLIDLNLMQLLVDSAHITTNDIILEVGCGTGSLTEALAERAGHVISIEIDNVLVKIAKAQLAKHQNVEILNIDILESKNTIDPKTIELIKQAKDQFSGRTMLVSNLPYSVASPVMVNLTTGHITADCMYVTVQKEVAQRMAAAPNTDDYGTLSIYLAATGDIKIQRILKPSVFWPQPQINSAMVAHTRNEEKIKQIHDMELFSQVVSLFMQHRRKMLKPCTKFAEGKLAHVHNWSVIFTDCCIDPHKRPETLTPQDYVAIANLCASSIS